MVPTMLACSCSHDWIANCFISLFTSGCFMAASVTACHSPSTVMFSAMFFALFFAFMFLTALIALLNSKGTLLAIKVAVARVLGSAIGPIFIAPNAVDSKYARVPITTCSFTESIRFSFSP